MQRVVHVGSRCVFARFHRLSLHRNEVRQVQFGLQRGRLFDERGTSLTRTNGVWGRSYASSPWPSPVRSPKRIENVQRTRVTSDGYTHFARQTASSGQRPIIRYVLYICVGGAVYYIYKGIDYAPFTGRVRFMGVSRQSEMELGRQAYEDLLQSFGGTLLAPNDRVTQRVRRIVVRLAQTVKKMDPKLADGFKWAVAVADVAEPNAMCVPGGKIVITTGLLRILRSDDDIAIILAHEIAHALNRHGVESMTLQRLLLPLVMIANQILDLRILPSIFVTLFLSLPYSRRLEHEADSVGLLLATEACYDARAAPGVFQRLATLQDEHGRGKNSKLASFLSTHPHTEERAERLRGQLSDHVRRYNDKCVHTNGFDRFASGFDRL